MPRQTIESRGAVKTHETGDISARNPASPTRSGKPKTAVTGNAPRPSTLADQALEILRGQLVRCELAPGSRFTESDLAASLGLGKTPIREALARLEYLGFVRALPRIGYEVTPITIADVRDVFALRQVVEAAAARDAAGRVDEQTLRFIQTQLQKAKKDSREAFDLFLHSNHQLHMHIATSSGNARLARVVEELLHTSERIYRVCFSLTGEPAMVHDHAEIVDALLAGDADAAAEIAGQEMVAAKNLFVEISFGSPSVQETPIIG
jgi:DNA-binding GntR family transcriptional regulator